MARVDRSSDRDRGPGVAELRAVAASAAVLLAATHAGTTAAGAVSSGATGSSGAAAAPCTLDVQPDTVTIRQRPARVLARVPRDLGEPVGADVPESSGVDVVEIEADAEGTAWIVRVDLSDARSGRWTLVLEGSEGRCEGVLTTRMPGQAAAIDVPLGRRGPGDGGSRRPAESES